MRYLRIIAALALACGAMPASARQAEAGAGTIYERAERWIAADPERAARLGKPAPEMASVAWLAGGWAVTAEVEGRATAETGRSQVVPLYGGVWLEIRDTYPGGTQDVGYLGFDSALGRWVAVSIDSLGNANRAYSAGWEGGKLVFEGDYTILGLPAHLRQTMERLGPDEYRVTNEERAGEGWRLLDRYRYRRELAH